ncbi:MAG: PmoA family protein [Fuerstiella sp.]|nr:PmoA family protein [Fuerstiella sp.]
MTTCHSTNRIALTSVLLLCLAADTMAADHKPDQKSATSAQLRLTETAAALTITQNGRNVLVYNKQSPPVPNGIDPTYRRSGFLHPVVSPAGKVVTATFPFDHPHQHGIFSAWVRTRWNDRDVDFWNLAGGTGRVVHERVVSSFSDDETTGFEVDLVHRAVQEPVTDVLRERWKVTARPTDGTWHCFDLETTQTALTDEPLSVNKYHYGGIALRGPVRWLQRKTGDDDETRESSEFLNDHGSERLKGNHEHAKWVSLTGTIKAAPVSITVLCHAENFRAPQAARLHPTKPYFCFAPCVDGEFVIDKDHPFHGRYRFLITDAAPNTAWLHQQWNSWCMPGH